GAGGEERIQPVARYPRLALELRQRPRALGEQLEDARIERREEHLGGDEAIGEVRDLPHVRDWGHEASCSASSTLLGWGDPARHASPPWKMSDRQLLTRRLKRECLGLVQRDSRQ